jgi:hypothetical protein
MNRLILKTHDEVDSFVGWAIYFKLESRSNNYHKLPTLPLKITAYLINSYGCFSFFLKETC